MAGRWHGFALALTLGGTAALWGCQLGAARREREKLPPSPPDLLDRDSPVEALDALSDDDLQQAAEQIRKSRRPKSLPDKTYNILAISGGGTYGSYPAGALVGWTERGDRPAFDVITGVSTGALIAAVAFVGPDYDPLLRELYTTVCDDDIYVRRGPLRMITSDSLASNEPMERYLRRVITPDTMARIAAEHARGRRLYVGTTNLPTRRLVVWDMGAIASRATPQSEKLFEDLLLASSAVPGFFPPQKIDVDVDGTTYTELHVDGGVSRALFFRPPYVPPSQREGFGPNSLYNSHLYVLVAGKLYADPDGVRPRALAIAGAGISSLLYTQGRGDIDRLYHYSTLTGMKFHLGAIPAGYKLPASALSFDPAVTGPLFETGRQHILDKTVWQERPPAFDRSEEVRARTGTSLTVRPGVEPNPGTPAGGPERDGVAPEGIPIPAVPGVK